MADVKPLPVPLPDDLAAKVTLRYRLFRGNPPHSPAEYGWVVRRRDEWEAGRYTPHTLTKDDRAWLKAQGFKFFGGKWLKPDGWDLPDRVSSRDVGWRGLR